MTIEVKVKIKIYDDKRDEFDKKIRNAISKAFEIHKDDMTFSAKLFKSIHNELCEFCTPWITYCYNESFVKICIIKVNPEYGVELAEGLIIGDTI